MNDRIELRQKIEDVDISDPSKLTPKDYAKVWVKECYFWHNRVLEGEKKHYCPDWDYIPIDETCEEIVICTCNLEKK